MTTTQQRNYVQEWINEGDTFYIERYMHALRLQKDKEDLKELKKKAEKKEAEIKKDPEAWLAKLKTGKAMGYNKDGEQVEVTAYRHPIHDNEALFIQEMPDSDEIVYRILDCCGDNNHYDDLGTALNEFLGVVGEHMWIDSLSYNQHTNRDIWIN